MFCFGRDFLLLSFHFNDKDEVEATCFPSLCLLGQLLWLFPVLHGDENG